MIKRSLGLAAVLCLIGQQAEAQAALRVHPSPGLYGPDDQACTPNEALRIASIFCGAVDTAEERGRWGARFAELMTHRFGNHIRADLAEALPDGVSREAMLSQTVVASLHLSRADLWTVRKPRTVEVHVPITLSLLMTNVLTGEVMFVESLTTDVQGAMTPDNLEARVAAQFPERLDAAIVNLVEAAHARFRPGAISGTIRGKAGDNYVIDIGHRDGLREGDELGADARVIFAGAEYAVVKAVLGELSPDQILTRLVATPVDNLARPTLLIVPAVVPENFGQAYLTTLVEDAVAGSGGFALTTVNASANGIRVPALGRARVEPRPRAMPDYFLRVSVAALAPIEADTNVAGTRRRVQEARAFFEVINHEGRVVFATQGVDQRIDEITLGMAPSTDQRRDAAIKNAIAQAATFLSRDFNPSRLRLELRAGEGDVAVQDPGGVLGPGAQAIVVRRVGRLSGIEGDVWAPVTQVEVYDIRPGAALARYTDVETPLIRNGDQVAYEAAGAGVPSRQVYAQCMTDGAPALSIRGLEQPLFQSIAVNGFSSRFRGAVHVATFPNELARLQPGSIFEGYDRLGVAEGRLPDICFEPAHRVISTGHRPNGRNFDMESFDLTAGYVLHRGAGPEGERVGATGLQQNLSATATPRDASADYKSRSLQIDLAEAMTDLTRRAAGELTPPQ